MHLSRRQFLNMVGAAVLSPRLLPLFQGDWLTETPLATSVRQHLESAFIGLNMALDFRRINATNDEEFRIQINAFDYYPVASCFKAWIPLYYYLNTPRDQWNDGEGSALYSTVVFSSNTQTGFVLSDVRSRARGDKNAIEKFNDFLRRTVGVSSGLYSWNWDGSPTVDFFDLRFTPSENNEVWSHGQPYLVDNVFTAADLAHGYDVLTRGPAFARSELLHDALVATDKLLSIRAPDYISPIEYVFPDGYMGKDGILPETDLPTRLGRVVNDAGVLAVGDARYIVAFMSAGESESVVRNMLQEVINQIHVYETGG
jgi:hypothetical protein